MCKKKKIKKGVSVLRVFVGCVLTCVFAMFTNTFAAALSTWIARRMVAPSLVTLMPPSRLPIDCKILSIPEREGEKGGGGERRRERERDKIGRDEREGETRDREIKKGGARAAVLLVSSHAMDG